jgi:hypothetical protein
MKQLEFVCTIIISLSRKRYTSQKSWGTLDSLRLDKKLNHVKGYAPMVSNHKNGIFLVSHGIFTDHFSVYNCSVPILSTTQGSFSSAMNISLEHGSSEENRHPEK